MKEISRRTVLAAAASVTATLSLPPSAAAVATKPPAGGGAAVPTACGMMGNTQACVTARTVMDVTQIQYTLTNSGNTPASYNVWYVDETGGPEASSRTVSVEAGESTIGYFYGDLQHCFTLHTCPEAGGECLILGPVCAEVTSGWMY
jgi:hypothetical protein